MATYLVTGGAGFIGSHLCEALLEDQHKVYVIDNLSTGKLANIPKGVEFIEGDIRNHSLVNELMEKVDGCFHLAAIASVAISNEDWLATHDINETSSLYIIEAARANSRRSKSIPVVFASSAAVYGNSQKLPLTESDSATPISIYGLTKLSVEHYAHIATQLFNVPFTALRLFNVYGPRQSLDSDYSGVISLFLDELRNNKPLVFYGEGDQTRDFIFVKEVVKFFIKAMETSKKGMRVFNVCSGQGTSIKNIADCLSHSLNKVPQIIHKPRKEGDIYHSLGDPSLANRELNIKAETPIKTGLEHLAKVMQ